MTSSSLITRPHPYIPYYVAALLFENRPDSTQTIHGTHIYRYGEYVAQLAATATGKRSGLSSPTSEEEDKNGQQQNRDGHHSSDEEACRESLRKLDDLWEESVSALGFVIPLLKEVLERHVGCR